MCSIVLELRSCRHPEGGEGEVMPNADNRREGVLEIFADVVCGWPLIVL